MNKSRKKTFYILATIILIVTILILLFAFRAYTQYSIWKSHHNYFDSPNPKIESWMTIKMISSKFSIPSNEILKKIGADESQINQHVTLERFCRQHQKNCTTIIETLNNEIGE